MASELGGRQGGFSFTLLLRRERDKKTFAGG
jgi:hypothetical protein